MSQFHNNNLIHNLRVGVRMIEAGMHPDVVALALEKEDIMVPAAMLQAAAIPGVLDSMGVKPYTHARADQQIAAHKCMRETLAQIQESTDSQDDARISEVFDEEI